MKNTLWQYASSIVLWFRAPEARYVISDLREYKERKYKSLVKLDGPDLYRAQGALEVLDYVLDMEKEMLDYLEKVQRGEFKEKTLGKVV